MPHMSNLPWLPHYLFLTILILFMMINYYFNTNILMKKSMLNNPMKQKSMNKKWQW